jgi:hypothetical protein
MIPHPRQTLTALALAFTTALPLTLTSTTGCGGNYVEVGGYEAVYRSPPQGVDKYPHFVYAGEQVYDVNGQYFRKYEGRWVSYRLVPPEVARWHEQNMRGRAEKQR